MQVESLSVEVLLRVPVLDSRLFPADIIPVILIDAGAAILVVIVVIGVLYKLRFWRVRALSDRFKADVSALGAGARASVLLRVVGKDALAVEPLFSNYRGRWIQHFLVFYGFIGLMITTTLDAIVNREAAPLPLDHPVKIIGNIAGVMLLIGATPMLFRKKDPPGMQPLGLADKIFLPVLYLAVVTGFVTEVLDYSAIVLPATAVYVIHIAIVTGLLASAPWTRFVHALQAPFLTFYERLRQKTTSTNEDIDYKRLNLAAYARDNFFPEYKEEEKKV